MDYRNCLGGLFGQSTTRQEYADAIELEWGTDAQITGIDTVLMSATWTCLAFYGLQKAGLASHSQVACPMLSPCSSSVAPEDCVYLRDASGPLFATLEALDAEQILWVQEMRGVEEGAWGVINELFSWCFGFRHLGDAEEWPVRTSKSCCWGAAARRYMQKARCFDPANSWWLVFKSSPALVLDFSLKAGS